MPTEEEKKQIHDLADIFESQLQKESENVEMNVLMCLLDRAVARREIPILKVILTICQMFNLGIDLMSDEMREMPPIDNNSLTNRN